MSEPNFTEAIPQLRGALEEAERSNALNTFHHVAHATELALRAGVKRWAAEYQRSNPPPSSDPKPARIQT